MIKNQNGVFASAVGVMIFVSTGVMFGACGGSDGSTLVSGNSDDASSSSDGVASGDGTTSTNDGSVTTDDGGSFITDGGANFGDAGSDDGGGDFPDGGTCNRTALGTSIMSACSFIPMTLNGGALQNGTYTLTKVTDVGSLTFCNKTFAAVPFEGGLVISSGSGGASDLELALDGDMTGRKSYSWSATPASTNKSPLSIDQSCPTTSTFTLPYGIPISSGSSKPAIEIEAPYGTSGGNAIYHFEQE